MDYCNIVNGSLAPDFSHFIFTTVSSPKKNSQTMEYFETILVDLRIPYDSTRFTIACGRDYLQAHFLPDFTKTKLHFVLYRETISLQYFHLTQKFLEQPLIPKKQNSIFKAPECKFTIGEPIWMQIDEDRVFLITKNRQSTYSIVCTSFIMNSEPQVQMKTDLPMFSYPKPPFPALPILNNFSYLQGCRNPHLILHLVRVRGESLALVQQHVVCPHSISVFSDHLDTFNPNVHIHRSHTSLSSSNIRHLLKKCTPLHYLKNCSVWDVFILKQKHTHHHSLFIPRRAPPTQMRPRNDLSTSTSENTTPLKNTHSQSMLPQPQRLSTSVSSIHQFVPSDTSSPKNPIPPISESHHQQPTPPSSFPISSNNPAVLSNILRTNLAYVSCWSDVLVLHQPGQSLTIFDCSPQHHPLQPFTFTLKPRSFSKSSPLLNASTLHSHRIHSIQPAPHHPFAFTLNVSKPGSRLLPPNSLSMHSAVIHTSRASSELSLLHSFPIHNLDTSPPQPPPHLLRPNGHTPPRIVTQAPEPTPPKRSGFFSSKRATVEIPVYPSFTEHFVYHLTNHSASGNHGKKQDHQSMIPSFSVNRNMQPPPNTPSVFDFYKFMHTLMVRASEVQYAPIYSRRLFARGFKISYKFDDFRRNDETVRFCMDCASLTLHTERMSLAALLDEIQPLDESSLMFLIHLTVVHRRDEPFLRQLLSHCMSSTPTLLTSSVFEEIFLSTPFSSISSSLTQGWMSGSELRMIRMSKIRYVDKQRSFEQDETSSEKSTDSTSDSESTFFKQSSAAIRMNQNVQSSSLVSASMTSHSFTLDTLSFPASSTQSVWKGVTLTQTQSDDSDDPIGIFIQNTFSEQQSTSSSPPTLVTHSIPLAISLSSSEQRWKNDVSTWSDDADSDSVNVDSRTQPLDATPQKNELFDILRDSQLERRKKRGRNRRMLSTIVANRRVSHRRRDSSSDAEVVDPTDTSFLNPSSTQTASKKQVRRVIGPSKIVVGGHLTRWKAGRLNDDSNDDSDVSSSSELDVLQGCSLKEDSATIYKNRRKDDVDSISFIVLSALAEKDDPPKDAKKTSSLSSFRKRALFSDEIVERQLIQATISFFVAITCQHIPLQQSLFRLSLLLLSRTHTISRSLPLQLIRRGLLFNNSNVNRASSDAMLTFFSEQNISFKTGNPSLRLEKIALQLLIFRILTTFSPTNPQLSGRDVASASSDNQLTLSVWTGFSADLIHTHFRHLYKRFSVHTKCGMQITEKI
ncbi:hypothetical protein BLNAU_3769 [Blattamonas nauphoetae]|uniref:Uncharacterized protein n=1 Tax=Blattamonas nauphoetae TaxID=2049346 RepID=A0ABQ9YC23_9EUKA|nr:hypothetical protein BLNAU_3769 [Blattamonas nauphoetae]